MELITSRELSETLQVTEMTLWRWREQGMPCRRLGSRTIRYELDKVMNWLENGK